ncbi:MAG: PD-(D/E)XK nuclease family protein [Microcystaceae cyanobacterium]
MSKIWQFASYNLWLQFSAPMGQEIWHCDRKRGYTKAKKKDPQIKALLDKDTPWQRIGLLAQQGVYEFSQNTQFLESSDGIKKVANILQLERESSEVVQRVLQVLKHYYHQPILQGKNIIHLLRGDEGFPQPILIWQDNYPFNLFAAIDCIFREEDSTLHILDFKTGRADFDRRQALVYLLAVRYLYPNQPAKASFYNLESCQWSDPITANIRQLNSIQRNLAKIAKKHQQQLWQYRQNPETFEQIYPAKSGINCQYCIFKSLCQFATFEVFA